MLGDHSLLKVPMMTEDQPRGVPAATLARGGTKDRQSRSDATGRRVGSSTAQILVLGSLVASFLATSSAPTPLWTSYAREWNLTPANTSLAFGVYALFLLLALLLLGRISDHLGRRPVLLAAIFVQLVALVVFFTAGDLEALLVSRVLQGISTGVGVAAVGAALLDVDTERGTLANSIAPAAGSAIGAMASALAVQFLPAPTHLIYAILAAVLLVQALMLLRLPETSQRMPGALRSLRPDVRLPPSVRGRFLAAAPVLFAVWALSGLFGSLGPALVEQLTGSDSQVLGAVPLAVLGVVAPLTAYRIRRSTPTFCLALGIGTLAVGALVTMLAVLMSNAPVLFVGALLSGIGFGSGFRGGVSRSCCLLCSPERGQERCLLSTSSPTSDSVCRRSLRVSSTLTSVA